MRLALEAENIEARPVWKPMHMQPVFRVERLKAEGSKLEAGENDPQISQIDADCKKKEKRYKARPSEIRSDKLNAACCDSVNLTRQAVVNEFHGVKVVGGEVAEDLFNRGLCLPSGTAMTNGDLNRVVETILNCRKK